MNVKKFLLLVGFLASVFASQEMWVTFSPIVSMIAPLLSVPNNYVGYIAITYPAFFLVLTIPSGILLDRNFKLWFIFGIVLTFLGSASRIFDMTSYLWLFSCQILGAIGQPFILNSFVPFASRIYPKKSTTVISLLSLFMYLGTIIALSTGVLLYKSGGLLYVIIPSIIISFVGMLLVFATNRIISNEKIERKKIGFRNILWKKDLWIVGIVLGLGVATFDNLSTWSEPALATVNLQNVAGTSVGISIIAGLIGVIFIPSIVSKKNRRTLYLRIIVPIVAFFFAFLSLAINMIMLFVFLTASGFLMIPAYPILMDWIEKFHKKEVHGSATGFVGLVSRIISLSLTFLAGDFIYSASVYFIFLTISVLGALIFVMILPKDSKMQAMT